MISLCAIEPVFTPARTDRDLDATSAAGTGALISGAVLVSIDSTVDPAALEHDAEVFLDPLHLGILFGRSGC